MEETVQTQNVGTRGPDGPFQSTPSVFTTFFRDRAVETDQPGPTLNPLHRGIHRTGGDRGPHREDPF